MSDWSPRCDGLPVGEGKHGSSSYKEEEIL